MKYNILVDVMSWDFSAFLLIWWILVNIGRLLLRLCIIVMQKLCLLNDAFSQ